MAMEHLRNTGGTRRSTVKMHIQKERAFKSERITYISIDTCDIPLPCAAMRFNPVCLAAAAADAASLLLLLLSKRLMLLLGCRLRAAMLASHGQPWELLFSFQSLATLLLL